MEDPTSIGNCEGCGDLEYRVVFRGRLLCTLCITRGPAHEGEPEQEPSIREGAEVIGDGARQQPGVSLLGVAIVVIAAWGLFAHQQQETEIQLLKQQLVQMSDQLSKMDAKLDRALSRPIQMGP